MHAHTNEPVYHHFRPCLDAPPSLRVSISARGSTGSELRNLRARLNPRRLIDYEAARETPADISNREIRDSAANFSLETRSYTKIMYTTETNKRLKTLVS